MQTRGPKSGFRKTIALRRKLRQDITPAEKLFWSRVAKKQFYNLKFRKQHGIGGYIVDFYCSEKKLIIEVDGDSHFLEPDILKDRVRDKFIVSLGYRVVRYLNNDILNNIDGVFQDLKEKLGLL